MDESHRVFSDQPYRYGCSANMAVINNLVSTVAPHLHSKLISLHLLSTSSVVYAVTVALPISAMGAEPPFLYDPPSKFTFASPGDKSFNPKAVTQASQVPPRTRPKPDGPLINSKDFNRHPDSYFVV